MKRKRLLGASVTRRTPMAANETKVKVNQFT